MKVINVSDNKVRRPLLIDGFDLSNINEDREESFVHYEQGMRERLERSQIPDRRDFSDQNGNYYGSYGPERRYVTSILAFLDEYNLEIEIQDISDIEDDQKFARAFSKFDSKIDYIKTRFALRSRKAEAGEVATPILIEPNFKEDIYKHLGTIRKIINQEVLDESKKNKIFEKILLLQNEIDREKTTKDALFNTVIQVFGVLGECAEQAEPAVKVFERIMMALYGGVKQIPLFPKTERLKLVEHKTQNSKLSKVDEFEDEIPF